MSFIHCHVDVSTAAFRQCIHRLSHLSKVKVFLFDLLYFQADLAEKLLCLSERKARVTWGNPGNGRGCNAMKQTREMKSADHSWSQFVI